MNKLKRYSQASPPGAPGLSPDERERLILQYAPLVKTIAGRLGMRLPQHVSQDDLVSAGIMGLLDAVDKFNEDKGVAFKSYAEFRIRGAMLDELRAMDWVPRSVRRNARRLEAAFAKVENESMRPATDEEVARELGIDMEAYYGLLEETRGISVISEDDLGRILPAGGADHSPRRAPAELVPDNPSDSLDLTEIRDVIAEAIEKLPKNERTVVSLYYYEELTMKEIGDVMDYTESRISQLHTKAVLRLRGILKGYFGPGGA
ncbi:MAG: FliA/WhiG family RNA polymerase sigma factor [Deltaproteobacteria bacterium]|nr:FliA/WhiG family RNA polymerase sigma factor [Deltaproteobacteria bacterium]